MYSTQGWSILLYLYTESYLKENVCLNTIWDFSKHFVSECFKENRQTEIMKCNDCNCQLNLIRSSIMRTTNLRNPFFFWVKLHIEVWKESLEKIIG